MFANQSLLDPTLINTIGHTSGVLLFAFIIVLLMRDGRVHGMRQIRMSLLAAALAFGWNAGSLIVIASPQTDSSFIAFVTTASFSVLSMLPAVLLQVTLQGRLRWIVAGGYLVSSGAVVLHFGELFSHNPRLHQLALLAVVAGFGFLTIAAFWLQARRSEWLSLSCLLLFTTSLLHFGYEHVSSPWAAEITWHHLGIPVALIVLLQDYRFLLLDAFVRFVVNACLAAAYVATVFLANQRFHLGHLIISSAFATGVSVVAFCLSLILFASLRNALQSWVSKAVFRRRSVEDRIQEISKLVSRATSEDDLLGPAAEHVAEHLGTDRFVLLKELRSFRASVRPSVLFSQEDDAEMAGTRFRGGAQIPLRFSSGDTRFLLLGSRRGGRRYLSEDLDDMRRLGAAIVEQVERFRADELKRLVSQAELRALQAQVNPHFLFNALNALYGTIDRQSSAARRLVLNLADIFRYLLQGDRKMIPLPEELRIVQAYLEIEQVRLGDRIETELRVSETARDILIPILSIQPLVENAVKHGIAPKRGAGRVSVRAERNDIGVRITVEDTGVGFEASGSLPHNGTGLGLQNVRRRLAICYGSASELEVRSNSESTIVSFLVPHPIDSSSSPKAMSVPS